MISKINTLHEEKKLEKLLKEKTLFYKDEKKIILNDISSNKLLLKKDKYKKDIPNLIKNINFLNNQKYISKKNFKKIKKYLVYDDFLGDSKIIFINIGEIKGIKSLYYFINFIFLIFLYLFYYFYSEGFTYFAIFLYIIFFTFIFMLFIDKYEDFNNYKVLIDNKYIILIKKHY